MCISSLGLFPMWFGDSLIIFPVLSGRLSLNSKRSYIIGVGAFWACYMALVAICNLRGCLELPALLEALAPGMLRAFVSLGIGRPHHRGPWLCFPDAPL